MPLIFLFDVDGTLVDTSEAHLDAWKEAMEELGEPFDLTKTRSLFGQGTLEIARALLPEAPPERVNIFGKLKEELYWKHIGKVLPLPEAAWLLRELHSWGHCIVLATGATQKELSFYLDLLGVQDVIEAKVCLEECIHSKPDPEVFIRAQEKAGADRRECVVVGDSLYDMVAAQRGGFAAIGVETGGFAREALLAAGALWVYRDVASVRGDLEALLDRLVQVARLSSFPFSTSCHPLEE